MKAAVEPAFSLRFVRGFVAARLPHSEDFAV